ncbi:hypothetical protein Tco_0075894 [Tanacetum coccineum]
MPPRRYLFQPLPALWVAVGGGGLAAAAVDSTTNPHKEKNPELLPIFPCMGLTAAKPPSWWRSDDGTATTAAPCGVGLWQRNPSRVPRCAQPLDATAVAAAKPAVATTTTTAAPWL